MIFFSDDHASASPQGKRETTPGRAVKPLLPGGYEHCPALVFSPLTPAFPGLFDPFIKTPAGYMYIYSAKLAQCSFQKINVESFSLVPIWHFETSIL